MGEKKRQAGEGEQASAELSVSVTLETTQENRCDYSHRHIRNKWNSIFKSRTELSTRLQRKEDRKDQDSKCTAIRRQPCQKIQS